MPIRYVTDWVDAPPNFVKTLPTEEIESWAGRFMKAATAERQEDQETIEKCLWMALLLETELYGRGKLQNGVV